MHLITFGPQGTFCHRLAEELTLEKNISLKPTLADVCKALSESEGAYALLPLSNSTSGTVVESHLGIETYRFKILAKYERSISYCLAGSSDATILFAHPHAYQQCKNRLKELWPHLEVVFTPSNAQSAVELENQPGAAALIAPEVAKEHHLPILATKMEDKPDNRTRFALVEKS